MKMIYLKQYNSLFNSPVVKEPNRDFGKYWDNPLLPKHFYENDFNKDLNTYNQWKQSAIPVVGEHLFEDGKEYQEGLDFELQHQLFSHWADGFWFNGFWFNTSKEEYDKHHPNIKRIVAIPIKRDVEHLLKPRYKVINDYPGCDFEIGEILQFDGDSHRKEYADRFPHLFKRLEWFEDRELPQLPKYVRIVKNAEKFGLPKNCVREVNEWYKSYTQVRADCFPITINAICLMPATKEDYDRFNATNKTNQVK